VKTLVIGGTRFMGVATIERLLAHGHEVTILNRGTRGNPWPGRVRLMSADRTVDGAFASVAGDHFDGVVDFCSYNASDSSRLLRELGPIERLVHISSGTVYRLDTRRPWGEDTAYGPERIWGDYARGKVAAELLLRSERTEEVATTAIRLPWVLGPGSYADRERFVFNRLLDREKILVPGDGAALQHFVSARGAAHAIVAALETFADGGWRAFNVASPEYRSLVGFVAECAEVAGVDAQTRRLGGGPTGTDEPVFDMSDCVFPFPNETYVLDLAASVDAGVAPEPERLAATLEASLAELRTRPELRRWTRTPAELRALRDRIATPAPHTDAGADQ
jgi:2'-hydroxyisoflavone reductase